MAYIVPRVLINQEFTQVPVFADQPLAAFIFGPQFNLYRYGVSGEKALTAVIHPDDAELTNVYQPASDVTYDLPSHVSGTKVDEDYTKVYFDNAEVEYYPNELASTSGAITRLAVPNSSKYYPSRFKASTLVFATANSVDRSTEFSLRDVAPGDYVVLHSDASDLTFKTKIKALHYSKSAASNGTVTQDTDNPATVAQDIDNAVVEGDDNTGTYTVANDSTGFKGGFLSTGAWVGTETFTATITTGWTSALSDLRFTITSLNGLRATATGVALTTISGDAERLLLFTDDAGGVVTLDFTGTTDGDVGDTFSVTVVAAVSHTYVPTASGTYTGTKDTVYKLTVVRGGEFYDGSTNGSTCARVAITSSGTDSSATVSPQVATNFLVGSYGISAQFALQSSVYGGLVLGDIYYIPVTAAAPADTNILEVYDTLPADLTAGTTTDWEITSLRLVKDYELNQTIPGNEVDLNWEQDVDANTITINSGITTADDLILDNAEDPLQLNVVGGNLYVEHRDLVVTNSVSIGSISDPALVEATLGTVHPDNPLAQGVYDALLNSNNVSVYYAGIATNDLAGFNGALSLARKKDVYYGLVPLTFDTAVHAAVVAHVNAMSTAEEAKWRVAWIAVPITKKALIYDLNDGEDWLGTLTDDPLTTDADPAVYTLLTVAGATFVTDGVRATDEVLINFTTDPFGEVIYDTYIVGEVRSETTLVILDGPTAAINSGIKVQIQRVYTKDEQIDNLASVGSDYNNRRVRAVFPETTKNAGVTKPGYFVAAALAGLRSGVVPHQGLTNTEVLGFDDLTDSVITFSEDQLNTLASEGYFILTQAVVGSTPYVRHQLTTASDSLNTSEDSITSNTDSISYGLQRVLEPYIGTWNVHRDTVAVIHDAITDELLFRQTGTYTVRAGNQLNGFSIDSLKQNATFKDRLDAKITLDEPYPLNNVSITLIV